MYIEMLLSIEQQTYIRWHVCFLVGGSMWKRRTRDEWGPSTQQVSWGVAAVMVVIGGRRGGRTGPRPILLYCNTTKHNRIF